MPNPLTPNIADGVLVATAGARLVVDGVMCRLRRGLTTAHPDAAVVAARPDLWAPLVFDYSAPASSAPKPPAALSAAKVRAWAKTEGLEVPARGPMPDDVIAAYTAAQD